MIPPFEDNGYLPAGLHRAGMDQVSARFGTESEVRRVQVESLQWLVEIARRVGVKRLVINGSFVTDILEPNDVDCILLIDDDFPTDPDAESELLDGLPFLEINLVNQIDFDILVNDFFATDRFAQSKGMVEIIT